MALIVHALGRLITERMELNGWSLPKVVARAEARGARLGKSNLDKLKNGMTPSISKATIEGLAAGLGVTPLTVANSALQSWGIEPHPAEVTDSIATIAIDPSLSDRDRRRVVALVKEMRDDMPESAAPRSHERRVSKASAVDDPERLPRSFYESVPNEAPPVRRREDGEHRDELGGG